jgi:hypothetical protein
MEKEKPLAMQAELANELWRVKDRLQDLEVVLANLKTVVNLMGEELLCKKHM